MDNLSIRYVFDRKKQATNTKAGLLQIEVRVNGTSQKAFISTGVRIFKNQFSDANGFTCKNHPNAMMITGKARRIFNKVEAFCLSEDCKKIEDVKNWNKEEETRYVTEFMKEQLRKSNPSLATLEHHRALIKKIEEFGKIKIFDDITIGNIIEFDAFLKSSGVKAPATLNKRHSTFRRYIKRAIYFDYMKKDPYFEFSMPSKKSKDPVFLEESEIRRILAYRPDCDKLEKVRDLFIFQCFTGMAYTDLMKFNRKDYIRELDGVEILRNRREKTDQEFMSVFLPEAKAIAERYGYRLPRISNQKYNEYLKVLGLLSGLKKSITTHTARHTFATYLLNKNVPIETVSRAMGHSSIRMTQHYARLLGKKVVSDMKFLLNT